MKKFFQRLTNWELWNFYVLYAPLGPAWAWHIIRNRAVWFFSPSNPTITFGGWEGEGKKEMYGQLPTHFLPRTVFIQHDLPFADVLEKVSRAGFQYPFVVKPDIGMKGILFRKIEDEEQLKKYHERMPVEYMVQDLVELPVEVSVFYYRFPDQQKGVVSGFIHKELLHVKGDGVSTLQQLTEKHPRAKHRFAEMKHRHGHRFDRVIPRDEVFYLSYAGNHNRGAHFTNLYKEIDDDLVKVFDELSHYSGQFYFGRYDIKTASIEDLKQGKNFIILEFNGCGAEPNHIYDCNMSLWKAYREILKHWSALARISRMNNRKGHRYWSLRKGWKHMQEAKKHFRLIEKYD